MPVYRHFKTSPRTDNRQLMSTEQYCLRQPKQAYFLRDRLVSPENLERLSRDESSLELAKALDFDLHVCDNFIGQIGCKVCGHPEQRVSLYKGYGGSISSSPDFVYCSSECLRADPEQTPSRSKVYDERFGLSIAMMARTRADEKGLAKLVRQGMGLPDRVSAEGLEQLFHHWDLRSEYVTPDVIVEAERLAQHAQRSLF